VLPAVAPPEPEASQLPVVATAEPVPFWKKEISFGRKAKAPKPPKAAKAPKHPEPHAEKPAPTPFWKRELSFGKKADKPASTPFWKKELSLGKKAEASASTPFWKKELSFGKRAPKPAAEEATVAMPKVKPPKQPFWKRELSFGKGARQPKAPRTKAPKGAKAGKGTVVGLKIGASQVAAARVANGDAPQLVQVARLPLPDGVVVAGELRDVETLAQTLKELFAKNKLPRRNVRLGIANNRIGVRTFEIGGIDDERQLANAIRFRAHETLPIPLEEAVLDWRVLGESVDPESGQPVRRVLLVVAYRDLVDRYVAACKKAGIRLTGIDLEAFAMLRALNAPRPDDGTPAVGAQVAVNVGHDRSTFAVSDGRNCEFTRVLSWGGQNLSVVIARALDITPSEAEPIKHALSLVASYAPPEGVGIEAMNAARDAVVRELQSFARELVSSLRFYQSQPGSLGIGEIVMTGGTAHLPGLSDELQRLIGVPVRVGDPLNRVAVPKKFREPVEYGVGSLTVAIGLGIED
jgi:type IV pilus assembly protein PilM